MTDQKKQRVDKLKKLSEEKYQQMDQLRQKCQEYQNLALEARLKDNLFDASRYDILSRSMWEQEKKLANTSILKIEKFPHIFYILSNPAFPEYYKIGITNNLQKRLAQYKTYSPEEFKCEYQLQLEEPHRLTGAKDIENHIKKTFPRKREWIKADLNSIINSASEYLKKKQVDNISQLKS